MKDERGSGRLRKSQRQEEEEEVEEEEDEELKEEPEVVKTAHRQTTNYSCLF